MAIGEIIDEISKEDLIAVDNNIESLNADDAYQMAPLLMMAYDN